MDISETQLHQQKQNPSNASGIFGEEKAAKIRKSLSPRSKRWLEKTKEDQPASKVPKPEVRPLGNTAGTQARQLSPQVSPPPARPLQHLPSLGHNTGTVSESPGAPCAATDQLRVDSYHPASRRELSS